MKAKSCCSSANRALWWLAVALYLTSSAALALPFTAYIDQFFIEKNLNTFFNDSFDDGSPPPDSPDSRTYSVNGSFAGGESGGKLRIGGNGYVPSQNAIGQPTLFNSATLQTNNDSNDSVNGLKKNSTFDVLGLFDCVTRFLRPWRPLDGWGQNDVVELRVVWSSAFNAPVRFKQDFVLGTQHF
jgi:hypothetical protein